MGADPLLIDSRNVVVFDDKCLLCSRFIRILLKNDKRSLFYAGFNTEFARTHLPTSLLHQPATVVFLIEGEMLFRSKAIFAILKMLRFPYNLGVIFDVFPTKCADKLYDYIARNRYGWFGRSQECFLPDEEQKSRFLD